MPTGISVQSQGTYTVLANRTWVMFRESPLFARNSDVRDSLKAHVQRAVKTDFEISRDLFEAYERLLACTRRFITYGERANIYAQQLQRVDREEAQHRRGRRQERLERLIDAWKLIENSRDAGRFQAVFEFNKRFQHEINFVEAQVLGGEIADAVPQSYGNSESQSLQGVVLAEGPD